jgi:hypothetical protein
MKNSISNWPIKQLYKLRNSNILKKIKNYSKNTNKSKINITS